MRYTYRILFGVLIVFAIVLAVQWRTQHFQHTSHPAELFQNPSDAMEVPKIIWTYWDSPDTMTDFVKRCIASWGKYNPNYTIHVLHKNTVKDYVDIPESILKHPNFNDNHARFADLLRLSLLEKHGGIWMDASCLMYQAFDEWLPTEKPFFAYYYNQGKGKLPYPVIENWFIMAKPQNDFVKAWKAEFLNLVNFTSVGDYVASRKAMGVDISSFDHLAEYLAMHVAAQKLLQVDKYPLEKLTLWDTAKEGGPFWFLIKHNWNAESAIRDACKNPKMRKPFLKFYRHSREPFERLLQSEYTDAKCYWF